MSSNTRSKQRDLAAQTTVMILAAGQGKRMLPLTENTPKPLLKIGEHALIEHHLLRLAELGFKHIVINIAYLATQIQEKLGNGEYYGLNIKYSDESDSGALETAGGIINALSIISSDSFIVINADIWTDYDFAKLLSPLQPDSLGRLVLVENPAHNSKGDFSISKHSNNTKLSLLNTNEDYVTGTYSGIAVYRKNLFTSLTHGHQALAPLLRESIAKNTIEYDFHTGIWQDIGTPERLEKLQQSVTPY